MAVLLHQRLSVPDTVAALEMLVHSDNGRSS